ncbi:MAG: peptidoglycan-associated lipoprotein Pal [Chlorobiaceae bacterium]|nr:peptidoglycan-associated lipoprotein Pal [Chlorobiaceae bacterium]
MRKKINGIFVLALMTMAGCSSKSAVTSTDGTGSNQTSAPSAASTQDVPTAPVGYGFDKYQTGPLGDVFFDYDSSILAPEAQEQLKKNAEWLGSNAAKGALVEGHCDSRGTAEYNLALGERRSSTAKEFLVKLGVGASRIETVSYGEERPFDSAQNEEAWSKNRRAHFVIK